MKVFVSPLLRQVLRASLSALPVLVGGCVSLNAPAPVDVLPTTWPTNIAATAPLPTAPMTGAATALRTSGSLYHPSSYRPPLEDQRARLVGDLVTIQITETINASQKSSSNVARAPSVSGGITTLPLIGDKLADKTRIGAAYSNTFEGSGNTASNHQFYSNITAVVTEVLPNGHLVITGEKQVGVNRSVDVLRFSGIVDPRHLGRERGHGGSVIQSRYVANVRVLSRGLGEQAEAQAMGWLGRVFNRFAPF